MEKKFACIRISTVSVHHAHCRVCLLDFTVAYGSILDVQRHVRSARHCKIGKAVTVKKKKCPIFLTTFKYSSHMLELFLSSLFKGWQV